MSDLLVNLERGNATADIEQVLGNEARSISVVTVSELLHGVQSCPRSNARRRALVEHILAGLDAIPITEPVARVHAHIWSDLADRGQAIGAHDLWIAATALANGLGGATRTSGHFDRVAGLRVVTVRT